MDDRVFKVAMSYIEASIKEAASKEDVDKIKKLIDVIKGVSKEKDFPAIENAEDFYEAAKTLGLSKQDFPKVIMSIFRTQDTLKLPSGLIGDIGEHLGDKKGVGVIPTSLLQRLFFMDDLDKKMGPSKWEFFFKDDKKLKDFKEDKGF